MKSWVNYTPFAGLNFDLRRIYEDLKKTGASGSHEARKVASHPPVEEEEKHNPGGVTG